MKVVDYEIIEAMNTMELKRHVLRMLGRDFVPHGSMMIQKSQIGTRYLQPMIKYEEKKKKGLFK